MKDYSSGVTHDEVLKKDNQFKEIWRRFKKNRAGIIGFWALVAILILIFGGTLIIPIDKATAQDYVNTFASSSKEYWFGTDGYGRDEFARILHGGKISLLIGLSATTTALLIGSVLGLTVGYYGGKLDDLIMRVMDVLSAIPTLLLAMTIVAALGNSTFNLILALTISNVPQATRVIRSSALNISDVEYIEAARAIGTKTPRIMFKHMLPNILGTVIVHYTLTLASVILYIATLSFVGLGVQPPHPEWGSMLSEAREYMRNQPMMMIYPGVSLALTVLALNLTGDGLRDAFDPKLK